MHATTPFSTVCCLDKSIFQIPFTVLTSWISLTGIMYLVQYWTFMEGMWLLLHILQNNNSSEQILKSICIFWTEPVSLKGAIFTSLLYCTLVSPLYLICKVLCLEREREWKNLKMKNFPSTRIGYLRNKWMCMANKQHEHKRSCCYRKKKTLIHCGKMETQDNIQPTLWYG